MNFNAFVESRGSSKQPGLLFSEALRTRIGEEEPFQRKSLAPRAENFQQRRSSQVIRSVEQNSYTFSFSLGTCPSASQFFDSLDKGVSPVIRKNDFPGMFLPRSISPTSAKRTRCIENQVGMS